MGEMIDMVLDTQQQILVEQRLANEKKSMLVAYLLWLFTGSLGGHRFYLGKTGTALVMLALFLIGVVTSVIYVGIFFILVVGIWVLVDAFLIPGMIEHHASGVRDRIASEIQGAGISE